MREQVVELVTRERSSEDSLHIVVHLYLMAKQESFWQETLTETI